jgi:two-component system, chemotaxis family, protein-glutamate methylesterase/glutaminase
VTAVTPRRVLVCEDSRVYATALTRALHYDGDITVAAFCTTAEEAIAALPRIRPDLVIMDLELPGMDGLRAVEEIMSALPLPILVLSASVSAESDKAAAVLAAGALDAIAKDDLDLRDPASAAGVAFRRRIRMLSRARVIRHLRPELRAGSGAYDLARRASVIGVCASTGGPQVLAHLLDALPADYAIPLLVVQHIGAGFTEGLVRWLDQSARLPVAVATSGARAGPGAWIAPEGAHLKLGVAGQFYLDKRTVAGHHCPSGDALFESIAAVAGRAGVAIVLSGMGADGAAGAAAVRARGGLAIAQDEESSAVYGMPKAAADLGVEVVLSPNEIATFLLSLVYEPRLGTR